MSEGDQAWVWALMGQFGGACKQVGFTLHGYCQKAETTPQWVSGSSYLYRRAGMGGEAAETHLAERRALARAVWAETHCDGASVVVFEGPGPRPWDGLSPAEKSWDPGQPPDGGAAPFSFSWGTV